MKRIKEWLCPKNRINFMITPFQYINHVTVLRKFLFLLLFICLGVSGFTQSRTISQTIKKIVYARDGGICQCCGSSVELEYDHITPYSCGGSNNAANIQLLCKKCNRSKSNSCFCKVHNKKVGNNCCENNTTHKHSGSSQQCTGTTKKGARCKKKTTNPSGRCSLHD